MLVFRMVNIPQILFIITLSRILVFPFSQQLVAQTPHRGSSRDGMVVNRRQVSHLLYENRLGKHYVTFMLHHGGIWAFQAGSFALRYECRSPRHCLNELKRISSYLKTGENLGLKINGSIITKVVYY